MAIFCYLSLLQIPDQLKLLPGVDLLGQRSQLVPGIDHGRAVLGDDLESGVADRGDSQPALQARRGRLVVASIVGGDANHCAGLSAIKNFQVMANVNKRSITYLSFEGS